MRLAWSNRDALSPATVKRQWTVARAWLLRDLDRETKL